MAVKQLRAAMGEGSASIYEDLRDSILTFDLMPGEAIGENMLAAKYGTSRTTVRSALKRLEEDTLVQVIPQKGTFVTYLDYDYIASILFIRLQVEYEILRRLAKNMPEDVKQRFEKCIAVQRKRTFTGPNTYFEMDSEFHHIVFDALGLPDVGSTIDKMDATCKRYRWLHYQRLKRTPGDLCNMHSELFVKLLSGDTDAVFHCFKQQIYGDINALKEALSDEWDIYFLNKASSIDLARLDA